MRWLLKLAYPLYLYWWLAWSCLYRWLFHRKYRGVNVLYGLLTPEEALAKLAIVRWQKDSWKELWDAMGSERWFQLLINAKYRGISQPAGAVDCEDFAYWCVKVLRPEFRPRLLNVQYTNNGTLTGHTVCLGVRIVDNAPAIFYLGNWGLRHGFASITNVVEDILISSDNSLVGWCLLSDKHWPTSIGLTLPKGTEY